MTNSVMLILALAMIHCESSGRDSKLGDFPPWYEQTHVFEVDVKYARARGCLQIHESYVEDVNRILGFSRFSWDDAFERDDSVEMMYIYTSFYAAYWRLGRTPTLEDIARIHKDGPNGYRDADSLTYWRRVEARLLMIAAAYTWEPASTDDPALLAQGNKDRRTN